MKRTGGSVAAFIAEVTPAVRRRDAETLVALLSEISGRELHADGAAHVCVTESQPGEPPEDRPFGGDGHDAGMEAQLVGAERLKRSAFHSREQLSLLGALRREVRVPCVRPQKITPDPVSPHA